MTPCAPTNGKRFTANEIEIVIGGFGGAIEAIEYDWDDESVTVYHRVNAPVPGTYNAAAAKMFGPDFYGDVLIASDQEIP